MDYKIRSYNELKKNCVIVVDLEGDAFIVEKRYLGGFVKSKIHLSIKTKIKNKLKKEKERGRICKTKTNPKEGFVYFIKEYHSNTYKIGKAKNLENRLRIFNVKLPFDWELIHSVKADNYTVAENLFHQLFSNKRIKGTEWFNLTDEDICKIKKNDFTGEILTHLI